MKRTIALFASITLALTLAPLAATASPSTGSAEQATAPASTAPSRFAVEFDAKKKKCTYLCVQSTLPAVEQDTYFVNGNRHLISMNTFSFTRRNLDTRKFTNRRDYPAGIALTGSAISRDGSTLVIAGTNDAVDFGNLHFSTVDTETFELTELTTDPSTTHPLTSEVLQEIAVSPDNEGFFLVQRHEGANYLCRFDTAGQEVGCSTSFNGYSSPIFFNEAGDLAYIVVNRNLYAFDIADMSFTETSIGDYELDPNGVMAADGNMYFYDNVGPFDSGGDTAVYQVTPSGVVTTVAQISGLVMMQDIAASSEYGVIYLIGRPKKLSGEQENFARVYSINLYNEPASAATSFKIKPSRGSFPEKLGIDSYGRYLLAFVSGMKTSVIPVDRLGSVRVATTATQVSTPSEGWQIDWDFINIAPGAPATKYQLFYQAPNSSKWRKMGKFRAGREHTTFFSAGVAGGLVKVMPIGVRVAKHSYVELVVDCGAPRVGGRQPRC